MILVAAAMLGPIYALFVDEIGGEKYARGWIDVRATGNISQKICQGTLAEENIASGDQ